MLGVAFKKTFSYAGFEMQPKKYKNPKIALLNVELELKAEKANAEVRVDTVEVCQTLFVLGILRLYMSSCQELMCPKFPQVILFLLLIFMDFSNTDRYIDII